MSCHVFDQITGHTKRKLVAIKYVGLHVRGSVCRIGNNVLRLLVRPFLPMKDFDLSFGGLEIDRIFFC